MLGFAAAVLFITGLVGMLPERKEIPGDLKYPWIGSRFALSPAPCYTQN